MRKKAFTLAAALLLTANISSADPVGINMYLEIVDDSPLIPSLPTSPVVPPTVTLDGHILYLYDIGCDMTVVLLDADGLVAYTALVPAGTASLVLPATLEGDYELRLVPGGSYYFWGDITL